MPHVTLLRLVISLASQVKAHKTQGLSQAAMVDLEQEQPITASRTKAADVETNYYEAGSPTAQPLVLLHGMSSSADSFRELQVALSSRYRTLAPDIPGFGESENTAPYTFPQLLEWLSAFLSALDTGPVHLIGHSFGGALAVSQALAAPERARTLILLAPSVLRPTKYPQWLRRLAQSRLSERVLELGVSASRLVLERQMRAAFYDASRFESSLWERRRRDYERARASAAVLRASALHDIRRGLHSIQQPSCIIWGQEDPVLEPKDAFLLNELMPESRTRLHILPECGHIPHIEQEEQVTRIITDFLESRANLT